MSAIIAIMNKHGVALAADSAVTISDGRESKIYPNANKIFTLSKFHPVGVMIYNSASFMDTPWEVLIKVYRKQLGRKSFQTVNDYYLDFIKFLKEKNFFAGEGEQRDIFRRNVQELLIATLENTFKDVRKLENASENLEELNGIFETQLKAEVKNLKDGFEKCEDFQDYELESFKAYSNVLINEILKDIFDEKLKFSLSAQNRDLLKEYLYEYSIRTFYYFGFSGLVFVGFGEAEIYPHLIPVHISFAYDNRLRYHIEETEVAYISDREDRNSNICAFAQTDVIKTILFGIDPDFQLLQERLFENFIRDYHQHMVGLVSQASKELKQQVESYNVDNFILEMKKATYEVQLQKFVAPLYQAVASLAKEDLGDMAESLIKLTYLKRRIMFHEESVGGPVDVAIITKGDGFIWEKRKHYFTPELNPHFFKNYLNTEL